MSEQTKTRKKPTRADVVAFCRQNRTKLAFLEGIAAAQRAEREEAAFINATDPEARLLNRERLAFHESGHCLLAWLSDVPIDRVSITPSPEKPGAGGFTTLAQFKNSTFTNETIKTLGDETRNNVALIAVSGYIAEALFDPDCDRTPRVRDREVAWKVLPGDSLEKEKTISELKETARDVLERSWPLVCELATALLAKGEMKGAEVFAFLNDRICLFSE